MTEKHEKSFKITAVWTAFFQLVHERKKGEKEKTRLFGN